MRATTQVSLAVRHVGKRGAGIECWTGTYAHCVLQLSQWIAPLSMATRFDLCIGRNEEDARRGVMDRQRAASVMPDDFNLKDLERLMDSNAEGEAPEGEDCGHHNWFSDGVTRRCETPGCNAVMDIN